MSKRFFDLVFSSLVLTLFSPFFLLIALAIKLTSCGPFLYQGRRVGLGGKTFLMYKFRTMVLDADRMGGPTTSEDDPRVTRIGALLRRYKLDELPQFINVFKGEMSVVGPRPDVEEVIRQYTKREQPILNLRPGITDYASLWDFDEGKAVKGAKDAHRAYMEKIWPTKVKLQLKYVREQSFLTDITIICKTIQQLFHGKKH